MKFLFVSGKYIVSPWDAMEAEDSFFVPLKQPQTQEEVDVLIDEGFLLSPADEVSPPFFYKMN